MTKLLRNYIDRYMSGTGAVAETATLATPQPSSFKRAAKVEIAASPKVKGSRRRKATSQAS
jgi:hypothetical protein